ncbi:nicotinamide mononucleotide transporter family protein, partial [Streptomyces sp. NRRL S-1896]|uniref:nicotinamide mononucleotide transporter family protein n=1 Tax=Streptomyces sp. NRRL S-1896 TaxID=1463893 RepID=UPI0004CD06F2
MTILDTPVSWTEVLGFGSGALCVWLVARQHLANWPIGIANNLFFILLFTQAGLYADAGLQIVESTGADIRFLVFNPKDPWAKNPA